MTRRFHASASSGMDRTMCGIGPTTSLTVVIVGLDEYRATKHYCRNCARALGEVHPNDERGLREEATAIAAMRASDSAKRGGGR